ncbi:MAG TPA: hypothetical protein VEV64_12110 [Rhizomicrobium sp.]|nr:hypothetical protein [Rhizomicrobium sp.]
MTMRSYWIVPAIALGLAACGPSDKCEVPVKPALLDAKHLSREQRANALGVPPDRVPQEAVTESPGALAAYEDYVSRHNDAAQAGYCLDNEAYKARNMKDEMSSIARAIMATCRTGDEGGAMAAVLKYRNCANGNK